MSALPPKADIGEGIAECPLMTHSGHFGRLVGQPIGRARGARALGHRGEWAARRFCVGEVHGYGARPPHHLSRSEIFSGKILLGSGGRRWRTFVVGGGGQLWVPVAKIEFAWPHSIEGISSVRWTQKVLGNMSSSRRFSLYSRISSGACSSTRNRGKERGGRVWRS